MPFVVIGSKSTQKKTGLKRKETQGKCRCEHIRCAQYKLREAVCGNLLADWESASTPGNVAQGFALCGQAEGLSYDTDCKRWQAAPSTATVRTGASNRVSIRCATRQPCLATLPALCVFA